MKTVQQIANEWRAIESRRPNGALTEALAPLRESYAAASEREQRLIDMIERMHATIQSYHREMGVLLQALEQTKEQP